MTDAALLRKEFEAFKAEVEARLDALEGKSSKTVKEAQPPKTSNKKKEAVIVATENNDIVASEE